MIPTQLSCYVEAEARYAKWSKSGNTAERDLGYIHNLGTVWREVDVNVTLGEQAREVTAHVILEIQQQVGKREN